MYSILIVDDERLIRKGIIAKLRYNKYQYNQIYEADNGKDAIDILTEKKPQIVITDIRMPNMDGIEFIMNTKDEFPWVKFIIISGYAEFSYAEKAVNMGVNGYLLKPIGNDDFVKTIDKVYKELDNDKLLKKNSSDKLLLERSYDDLVTENKLNNIFHDIDKKNNHNDNAILENQTAKSKYMLAIFNVDGKSYYQSQFNYQDIELLKFSIKNICSEIEIECNKVIFSNIKDRNQVLILFYDDSDTALNFSVDRFLVKAFNRITRFLNISLTIGISQVADECNSDLYIQARDAFSTKMLYGENKIYKHEIVNTQSKVILPLDDMKLLKKCIERNQIDNILAVLNNIFSSKRINGNPVIYIKLIWLEITNLIINICEDIDTDNSICDLLIEGNVIDKFECVDDVINYLYTTILDIFELVSVDDMDYRSRIKLALKYINRHYHESISINSICNRFDMNPSYFSTLFKKETNTTVIKYLTDVRLKKACELLSDSKESVVNISKNVGFEDSQYFFRVFKKNIGKTPLEYRKGQKKVQ